MLHYVLYHVFDKRHYLAEFSKGQFPKRVLDIGCGTGIWIHDVAREWREKGYTDVEFHGVDLVPIQTPMVPNACFKTRLTLVERCKCGVSFGECVDRRTAMGGRLL
jgi:cyclopropane fatty-acyl-phospholipid synthase-like methyltransferase